MSMRLKPFSFRLDAQSMPVTECGCWLWLGHLNNWGYGSIKHNGKAIGAHRASWIIHRGEIPAGIHVLHRCDIPSCINPEHLFLGSHDENMVDKTRKGRAPRGVNNPFAKLTSGDVEQIRAAAGTQAEIAARFGVHQAHVSKIRSMKIWKAA